LKVRDLFSNVINSQLEDDSRSTALSFIGMIRRLFLTILNPLVGLLVDNVNVFFAFLVLGFVASLLLFILPNANFDPKVENG
jgi:hypothetical protein